MKVKSIPVGLLEANAHLFWNPNTKEAVIFDCGGDAKKLESLLSEKDLKLTHIVLTHGHSDHIAGVVELKKITGAQVLVHSADVEMIKDPNLNMSNRFPIPPVSFDTDIVLNDGDKIDLIGTVMTVVHTPGHTKGSVCLEIGDYLVTGDTLFQGSIGRTDLYGGNMGEMQKSLKKLAGLSHRLIVLPGHGPKSSIRDEVKSNPYMK